MKWRTVSILRTPPFETRELKYVELIAHQKVFSTMRGVSVLCGVCGRVLLKNFTLKYGNVNRRKYSAMHIVTAYTVKKNLRKYALVLS